MAMKCVAQIPYPIAAPAIAIQISRLRPCDAIARRNILTATILATKQTVPASRTSRQSCSSVRHAKTRYIDRPLFVSPTKYSGWIFNLANILELSATWLSTCMSRLFQLYWSRPYSLHHPDRRQPRGSFRTAKRPHRVTLGRQLAQRRFPRHAPRWDREANG